MSVKERERERERVKVETKDTYLYCLNKADQEVFHDSKVGGCDTARCIHNKHNVCEKVGAICSSGEKKKCNFRHAVMCGEQKFGFCEFARTTDHFYEKFLRLNHRGRPNRGQKEG